MIRAAVLSLALICGPALAGRVTPTTPSSPCYWVSVGGFPVLRCGGR